MAHLVESMAYVGDTPWHGLGNHLSAHQPLQTWLVAYSHAWRSLNNIHADHVITSMPITQ